MNWKRAAAVVGGVAAVAAAAKAYLRATRWISLRNRVVLIAGGSRGLGLILAREFARAGARVAMCARSERELEHVREEFADNGWPLVTTLCDVGVRADVGRAVETVREQLGDIEILVNNAGTMLVGPAENQEQEAFEDAMQTNFWGPYYLTNAVLGSMKANRFGRVVNITSIGGKVAFPHLLPYSASKFALVGYSEGLRVELAKHRVFVTTVCPGLMRTGSPRNAFFTGQTEKEYAWFTISDSLPGASISARSAARKVINACIHGDAEIHLGISAKLGAMVQGCAPGATAELLSLVDQMLPDALPRMAETKKGSESESEATANPVTLLTREAEIANNQL
ncbi:MAG: SDR family oxidoreductase [Acidobacteria bacterium]|nr:SDR family oxidoreductase [Acidobacteriota bacterium]